MQKSDMLRQSTRFCSFTTRSSFLKRLRAGEESAWFEFHDKYVRMIRQIGTSRGLTPTECDDLMVDVMVIFWRKMETFVYDPERGRFRSFLGAIADFASLKILRDQRKLSEAPPLADYPDEVDPADMEEWRRYIWEKALGELRESVDTVTYEAFHMLFCQGRPVEEVAAVTRKSPNTLYGIRHRCIRKLKRIIAEYRRFEDEVLSSATRTAGDGCTDCRKTPPPVK